MRPYPIPYEQLQRMERMVKRNEKALLRKELQDLLQAAAGQPIEADTLYLATCHKQGAQVACMLMEAGLVMPSEKPLRLAVQRGLDDTALTLAQALSGLSALDPDGVASDHPLTAAVRQANVPLLRTLFALPCKKAWTQGEPELSQDEKACQLLRLLAMQPPTPEVDAHKVEATARFLVEQGADPNFSLDTALSMTARSPVLFQAAQAGNLPALKALVSLGADVHVLAHSGSSCPHPCPNAQATAIYGIRDTFDKNGKKVLPGQWEVLEYLAQQGLSCELGEDNRPFARLPSFMRAEDRERIARIMEHGRLMGETMAVEAQRARPRL